MIRLSRLVFQIKNTKTDIGITSASKNQKINKTDIGIKKNFKKRHVVIAGPSTLQGQLLAKHFLAQPDKYLVSAISASRADERFMKYRKVENAFIQFYSF